MTKKFEVKAKSAVQLIRSNGIILKPSDGAVVLDVDTKTDQMEELVRAEATGLITLKEVKVSKKKSTKTPKEMPKVDEAKIVKPPKEEKAEETAAPQDFEDEGASAEKEPTEKKSTRKKAADK